MFLSAFLSVIGLGFLCWLLFSLAVYALPFFVAVTVGYYAFDHGAGPMGAVVVALFAGAIALVLGQVAFGIIRSQIIRLALGALYALPSGVAGFHAVKGFSQVGGAGEAWTASLRQHRRCHRGRHRVGAHRVSRGAGDPIRSSRYPSCWARGQRRLKCSIR